MDVLLSKRKDLVCPFSKYTFKTFGMKSRELSFTMSCMEPEIRYFLGLQGILLTSHAPLILSMVFTPSKNKVHELENRYTIVCNIVSMQYVDCNVIGKYFLDWILYFNNEKNYQVSTAILGAI